MTIIKIQITAMCYNVVNVVNVVNHNFLSSLIIQATKLSKEDARRALKSLDHDW